MKNGHFTGLHYLSRQPIEVSWSDGLITSVEPQSSLPSTPGGWLAPSILDVQVNGYAGVDFQQDALSVEALEHAAAELARDGCARFFVTLITDDWPSLMTRLKNCVRLRSASPRLQTAIAGWHIEGPFLSDKPGFCGAHDPRFTLDPKPDHIHELRNITGDQPVLLTLAPERQGAIDAIQLAVSLGIVVSLGHSDAPVEVLKAASQAGATAFTHLGNGCTSELNRHDNILWRVLDGPAMAVSIIPDAIHVSPMLFRLMHRLLPPQKIVYTTDAMAAAGAGPGEYSLGPRVLACGEDGAVRQPGTPYLAGSALRPRDGVARAAEMLGCTRQEAWGRAAETPADLVGLRNSLTPGQRVEHVCVIEGTGFDLDRIRPLA